MAKRASKTGQTGSVGQTWVKHAFELMGWGPIPVTEHDSGTDFFVQVRDRNLFELGLLVGVQVKNEKDYFRPRQVAAAQQREPPAWEYRASQDDTSYWLNHSVPHVLVIYDSKGEVAYWAHVTQDAVRWTNKGAVITVQMGNRLAGESWQELLDIASSKRPAPTWSGSSWEELSTVDPRLRLRLALTMPRIAAPHGNRTPKVISAEEALGTLMECDFDELFRYEHRGAIPAQAERQIGGFSWRLFEALHRCLQTSEVDQLQSLVSEAKEPGQMAAINALLAALLIEKGHVRMALSWLDDVQLDQLDDPVDRAWIEVQRARCYRELGEFTMTDELALPASAVGLLHPDDPTAVALRSSALRLLDHPGRWGNPDHFQAMIRADDTAPRWWRGEQRSWALAGFLEDRFHDWADEPGKAHKHQRDAWQRLRSLVLISGVAGEHRAWRNATNQLAMFELMMADSERLDSGQLATILRDLRLSGSDDELKLAIDKLEADGPCEAVTQACHEVDLAQSTFGSFATDVQILTRGADLVAPADADRHVRWALAALADDQGIPQSTHTSLWMRRELVDLVRILWRQLGLGVRRDVIRFLMELPRVTDQSLAAALADLARRVPPEDWEEPDVRRLKERVALVDENERDHDNLINGWRSVLLRGGDERTRQDLMLEASQGSYDALLAIGSVTELSPEAVGGFIGSLRQTIAQQLEDARAGTENIGRDHGGTLLRLNVFFPDSADWEPIKWILECPGLPYHKAWLLETLELLAHKLPEAKRHMLSDSVKRLAVGPSETHLFLPTEPVDRAAIKTLHQLENPLHDYQTLASRLAGDRSARISVADAIGRTGGQDHLQTLISLSVDRDSRVRAAAGEACVNWMLRGIASDVARATLERLLDEDGRRISMHALRPIRQDAAHTIAWLLDRLESSPSSIVRSRVEELRRLQVSGDHRVIVPCDRERATD